MILFFADHGRHLWKGVEATVGSNNESAEEFASRMKKVRDEATAALEKAQKNMKKYYDKHHKPAPEIKIGDKVYLESKDISVDRPSKKLSDKWLGPYEVLEKRGKASYKLKILEMDKHYPVYHKSLLTPYKEPPPHRRELRPDPVIIDGEEEYEVEEILKSRKRGRGHQYLIKWKDYPMSENTWEPERNILPNAAEILAEYKQKNNINASVSVSVPILPSGHWDYLVKRYKTKQEALPYDTRKFFDFTTGKFITILDDTTRDDNVNINNVVDEDVDLRGGVMSESEVSVIENTSSRPLTLLDLVKKAAAGDIEPETEDLDWSNRPD